MAKKVFNFVPNNRPLSLKYVHEKTIFFFYCLIAERWA